MPDQHINGYYVAIPEKTLQSEQWLMFTPATRCVYWTMMLRYKRTGKDADGRVKWRQDEISQTAGLGLRTVITCLQVLKDRGWISIYEPGGRWLDGTTYDMNPLYANGDTENPERT